MDIEKAVNKAVDKASKRKCLGKFFEENRSEVVNAVLREFYIEEIKKSMIEEGQEEGTQIGRKLERRDNIRNAYKEGLSPEKISGIFKVSEEEIEEIVKSRD